MKTKKLNKTNFLMDILKEKCPHCGNGQVYEKNQKWFRLPAMKEECEACHYRYDREPGYFIGAMYLSYGLAVLEGIITFLICHFAFPGMATIWKPVLIMMVILLFAMKNFKLSRVIYMHIFPW
jgi:uncharacterized protein (DUF983 family)